jgi:hypothetical protein
MTTWLLVRRTLVQFPRNAMVLAFSIAPVLMMFLVFGALFEAVKDLPGFPTDNYFEYLAPAAVLMTTVPGIANAAVGLATDFQNRFLYKLLTTPASIGESCPAGCSPTASGCSSRRARCWCWRSRSAPTSRPGSSARC